MRKNPSNVLTPTSESSLILLTGKGCEDPHTFFAHASFCPRKIFIKFFSVILVRYDSKKVFQPSICLISDVIEFLLGKHRGLCRRKGVVPRENKKG